MTTLEGLFLPRRVACEAGLDAAPYNRPVILASAQLHNWYLPACVAGTVLLLLLLIVRVRLHAALGLMIAALTLTGAGCASINPAQRAQFDAMKADGVAVQERKTKALHERERCTSARGGKPSK